MIMVVRESIKKDCEKHLNTIESAEYTENNCSTLRSLCTLWLITYANQMNFRRFIEI